MGLFLFKCNFVLQSFLCQYKCPVLLDLVNSHLNTECYSLLSGLSFLSMRVLSSDLGDSVHACSYKCHGNVVELFSFAFNYTDSKLAHKVAAFKWANLLMYNT